MISGLAGAIPTGHQVAQCISPPYQQQGDGRDSLLNAQSKVEETAQAVFAALTDDTLPAELRQTIASLFTNHRSHQLPDSDNPAPRLLWSIVKSMAPEKAATLLDKMSDGIHTILRGVMPRPTLSEFLSIVDTRPMQRGVPVFWRS